MKTLTTKAKELNFHGILKFFHTKQFHLPAADHKFSKKFLNCAYTVRNQSICTASQQFNEEKCRLWTEKWEREIETLEEMGTESEESDSSLTASFTGSGEELRFLRTKKPARVAERKIKIILSGHISVASFFSFSLFWF